MSVAHIKNEIISHRSYTYSLRDHRSRTPIPELLTQAGFDLQKPYTYVDGLKRDRIVAIFKNRQIG